MKTNPLIVFRKEFDRSALLFNPENGETFGLNPTSAVLWECFSREMDENQALEALREKVRVLPENALEDIRGFAAQLREKHFIE